MPVVHRAGSPLPIRFCLLFNEITDNYDVRAAAHGRPLSFFCLPQKLKTGRHGVRPLRNIFGLSRSPVAFAYRGDGRPWAADPTGRLENHWMPARNDTYSRVFDMETLV